MPTADRSVDIPNMLRRSWAFPRIRPAPTPAVANTDVNYPSKIPCERVLTPVSEEDGASQAKRA